MRPRTTHTCPATAVKLRHLGEGAAHEMSSDSFGVYQKFPELPLKILGDFPGTSRAVDYKSNPEVPLKFPRLLRKLPELPLKFSGPPHEVPLIRALHA